MDKILEFKRVGFGYPGQALILYETDFSLTPGKSVLILGSNGSGKSTLAKLTAGVIKPDSGAVILYPKFQSGTQSIPKVGLVSQESRSQIVGATVEEDLAFGLTVLQLTPKQIKEKVDWYLDYFSLRDKKHFAINQLSGGELRRLALATVLIIEPDILILDEPLAMLDHFNQELLVNYLQKESERTILWLDNDIKSIRYTQKWYLLNQYGKLIAITESDLNSSKFLQENQLTPTPLQYLEWRYPERINKSLFGPEQIVIR
jgi:energy-coupling factor transporter ATP-binding protein EcfA2